MIDEWLPPHLLTAWSIRCAVLLMLTSLGLRIWSQRQRVAGSGSDVSSAPASSASKHWDEPESSGGKPRAIDSESNQWARHLWFQGSLFSLLHAIVTMVLIHEGSHQAAYESTAAQTRALLGFGVGLGVYVNYAFVTIWCADAIWWLGLPESYQNRPQLIDWGMIGFLTFVAFNGTVVFVTQPVRWLYLAGWLGLIAVWCWMRVADLKGTQQQA